MRTIGRLLVTPLTLIGLGTVLLVAVAVLALRSFLPQYEPLPARMLLMADWREGIPEVAGAGNLFDLRLRRPLIVAETAPALDRRGRPARGVGWWCGWLRPGNACADAEPRDAVLRSAAAGKLTRVCADTFGELGSGNEGYYLASAFKTIHLGPAWSG
ncbi:MAG: hypothetical protein U1E17_04900 [Geminicoccaceae bacterium]